MKRVSRFLLFIGVGLLILSSACAPAPVRNFSDQDLLVDVSVLPESWALEDIYTMDNEEGEESGKMVTFYKTDTPYWVNAGQDVFRYSSTRRAAWHYRRLEDYYFTPNIRETPPVIPEEFIFSSISADQWRLGCSDSTFSPAPEFGKISTTCLYWAQYDEFLIFATITIQVDEQEMASMADVYRFIEAVDQRMAQYLASEN